jgi:uncharacterized protein
MGRTLNALNNVLVRIRRARCAPQNLLLLFSSCLQKSTCECNIRSSLDNCKRCGGCVVGPLLDLAEQYGLQAFVAAGGRLAAAKCSAPSVKAIVAVACCKELSEGLRAVFPKPTLLVQLSTPNGPCKDTEVDYDRVRQAVEWFLRP